MFNQRLATASDYNRGLPAPIRWVHVLIAALTPTVDVLLGWTLLPRFRGWAPLVLFTLATCWVLMPRDGAASASAKAWFATTGGDLRREIEAIQQFGQGASMFLIGLAIFLLDPRNRARLLDWALGGAALIAACTVLKRLAGRPRPNLSDPDGFVGPLGVYAAQVGDTDQVRFVSAWSGSYDLASMPSSHTAFAVLAAVFLSAVYPRVWPLVWALAVVVGVARVLTGAHYPTDVLAGAALGLLIGRYAIDRQWGGAVRAWIEQRKSAKRLPVAA